MIEVKGKAILLHSQLVRKKKVFSLNNHSKRQTIAQSWLDQLTEELMLRKERLNTHSSGPSRMIVYSMKIFRPA